MSARLCPICSGARLRWPLVLGGSVRCLDCNWAEKQPGPVDIGKLIEEGMKRLWQQRDNIGGTSFS